MNDGKIIFIAAHGNLAFLQRIFHSATRLIDVKTIVEAAIMQQLFHFWKVVTDFTLFNIQNAKLLNARRVNNKSAEGQLKHFSKRSRVFSFLMITTQLAYP